MNSSIATAITAISGNFLSSSSSLEFIQNANPSNVLMNSNTISSMAIASGQNYVPYA